MFLISHVIGICSSFTDGLTVQTGLGGKDVEQESISEITINHLLKEIIIVHLLHRLLLHPFIFEMIQVALLSAVTPLCDMV
ncbi:MAG: hypothetical protein EZS28_033093 [Streblomastix strix]|uniref:Uncharacterized protein n=1 Tax=Streblomastix strix TaxID=222440 RepID=A0A5J4UMX6_9EUKA|nr:MAG: hypothetical protein EZS28_033093 [Streblomastix strix]